MFKKMLIISLMGTCGISFASQAPARTQNSNEEQKTQSNINNARPATPPQQPRILVAPGAPARPQYPQNHDDDLNPRNHLRQRRLEERMRQAVVEQYHENNGTLNAFVPSLLNQNH